MRCSLSLIEERPRHFVFLPRLYRDISHFYCDVTAIFCIFACRGAAIFCVFDRDKFLPLVTFKFIALKQR